MDCVICRYGELALKGRNRHLFEKKLVDNIRDCLITNRIKGDIQKVRGRVFVFTSDEKALVHLRDVFGLTSLSPAVRADADPEGLKARVVEYLKTNIDVGGSMTFRITTKRTDKGFPKTSNEMDVMLGSAVEDHFGFRVDLTCPDINIGVEIHDSAFIFHEKIQCPGGLPLGVSGRVACLVEDDAGAAAAWLVMRRGCEIVAIARKKNDIDYLSEFSYGSEFQLKMIKDIADANPVMADNGCRALVVGDTLDRFDPESYSRIDAPILTPLISYTKEQIKELVARIR